MKNTVEEEKNNPDQSELDLQTGKSILPLSEGLTIFILLFFPI